MRVAEEEITSTTGNTYCILGHIRDRGPSNPYARYASEEHNWKCLNAVASNSLKAPYQLDATIGLASYTMRPKNSHSLFRKSARTCGQQIHNSDVQRNAGAQERLDVVRHEAKSVHVLMHPICSLHQGSPNSWCSNHIGWCVPARWLETICCDMQQESGENSSLESMIATVGRGDFPFVRYTEISFLKVSEEEMWNTMCNKAGTFRKTLRKIRLASMC